MIRHMIFWVRSNLFNSPLNWFITIFLSFIIFVPLWNFLNWAIIDASWIQSSEYCRQQEAGACWGIVYENFLFLLFGFFPREELWRGWLSLALFVAAMIYTGPKRHWNLSLIWIWGLVLLSIILLLQGQLLSLNEVNSQSWGGLIVTIIIAMVGIYFAYPFGIVLALGRTSSMPIVRTICVGFIEFIRGVPFVSLLFMASLMLPLFLPPSFETPKLARAIVAAILFTGAYLAETVRGGLASIPRGQYEAADSLGLSYWQKMGVIILPQSLSAVIQPTIGSFISLFIDTSLVVIISMYDFLGAARAIMSDTKWIGFGSEMYVFLALVYFSFCYTLSSYSRRLEKEILTKKRH